LCRTGEAAGKEGIGEPRIAELSLFEPLNEQLAAARAVSS
jgi:hypothetical protein